MRKRRMTGAKRVSALLLSLLLCAALLSLPGARAQDTGKVVRVGWYESPFNQTDSFGRRSGYAYEYQQKIAAFTGWTYEYVEGSWPELLQKLEAGSIDLLSDVSFTEERAEKMLFSELPMGEEEYYIFTAPNNREISAEDYTTFNGKRVGVYKNSVQADFFREWAEAHGVQAELVEMMESVEESLELLVLGRIDMYVTQDAYLDTSMAVPICKVGGSDFYFALSKSRTDLLPDLDHAMSRILQDDKYYTKDLESKFIRTSGSNRYLTAEELDWLEDHGPIRVGYQDNYLAFCAQDPKTGELTGALKDYLGFAADAAENARIGFEAVCYPTAAAALEALKKGEVDLAFPANLTSYDGEVQGCVMTPPIMRTDITAIVRQSEEKTFGRKSKVTVAVNAGNTNYDMFLLDHFPTWRSVYFKDTPEGLRGIADGKVDCLLMSNYRCNNVAGLCRKYNLIGLSTGVEMDYCFAVKRQNTTLYSIMSKVTNLVPSASVNSSLTYYFTEDAKTSFTDLLLDNIGIIIGVLAGVALLFILLLLRSARIERQSQAEQKLITATETDELTGLYSRNFFYRYAEKLSQADPDKPMDAVALNITDFHSVNALKGKAFGDQTLQVLGREIQAYLKKNGGIGSREESDHFTLYCPQEEDWHLLLDRLQGVLDTLSPNASIRLRMGVMPWQRGEDPLRQFEEARTACRRSRDSAVDHLVVYDEQMREQEALDQRLLNDLRTALEDRQFEVHYQPKFDIRTDPPTLQSAEALVRWNHPQLGLIPPGRFIPLLERSGEINAVDKYVWEETARQIAAWKKELGRSIPVSVNLSRVDVFDPTLENVLDRLLEKYGLSCGELKLEVTESACTENGFQVVAVIERLRRKGYEIEMDDFGSGYSSLNMLSAMPIDVLKMDRAFVSNIEHEEKDLQLVDLILGLARSLKIPVIAEGVETDTQLSLLKDMGCAMVQGYYFSRPLPAAQFRESFLKPAE